MQITKKDLEEQREQIQEDLHCVLDGAPEELMTDVCQVIVDRMNVLIAKLDKENTWNIKKYTEPQDRHG